MNSFLIEIINAQPPWAAFLVRTAKYPLSDPAKSASRTFAAALLAQATGGKLPRAVLLQYEYLANGKTEFNAHLQQWGPSGGLGVWPDREAPRLWKTTDIFRMARGERVPLNYRLFRLTGNGAEADAFDRLMGTGMVVSLVPAVPVPNLLDYYKGLLLPGIQEPSLRVFPFYAPLLDAKSVKGRTAAELSKWLGQVRMYLRESPQDEALLVVSDLPVEPLLSAAGARRNERGQWSFAY